MGSICRNSLKNKDWQTFGEWPVGCSNVLESCLSAADSRVRQVAGNTEQKYGPIFWGSDGGSINRNEDDRR